MALSSRPAQPGDAASILTLAQAFASSFVVEPAAFQQAFSELLVDTHARLVVAQQEQQRYLILLVCGFSARSAEKPHTEHGEYHAAAGNMCSTA